VLLKNSAILAEGEQEGRWIVTHYLLAGKDAHRHTYSIALVSYKIFL